MMGTLADLEKLLAAAKEPSYELNDLIARYRWRNERPAVYGGNPDRYTSSIDAAVEFAEAMLPGCQWNAWNKAETDRGEMTGPGATIWHRDLAESDWCGGDVHNAATPALALCLAVVRALNAKATP